jgi:hypothetical protein
MNADEALKNMALRYEAIQKIVSLCEKREDWQKEEPELAQLLHLVRPAA